MIGWIKLHRQIIDSNMYKSLNSVQRDVMIQCLISANHESNKWEWKGQIFTCKPGQFITSLESLRKLCAKDTTIKMIRTALLKLEKWEFLANEGAKTGRLITIINWHTYQGSEDEEGKAKGKEGAKAGQDEGRIGATNKNDKEDKNDKEGINSVFDFWNSQGITKHKTIDKSKPSINASLKEYSEDEIKGAMVNYKKILDDSTYYWTHKWTLKEFLQRGMDKFRDENNPFDNYKADKKGGRSAENPGARKPEAGKYAHLDK